MRMLRGTHPFLPCGIFRQERGYMGDGGCAGRCPGKGQERSRHMAKNRCASPACLSAHQHPAVCLLPAAHVKVGRRNVYRWIHDSMHINNLLYNYMHCEMSVSQFRECQTMSNNLIKERFFKSAFLRHDNDKQACHSSSGLLA